MIGIYVLKNIISWFFKFKKNACVCYDVIEDLIA